MFLTCCLFFSSKASLSQYEKNQIKPSTVTTCTFMENLERNLYCHECRLYLTNDEKQSDKQSAKYKECLKKWLEAKTKDSPDRATDLMKIKDEKTGEVKEEKIADYIKRDIESRKKNNVLLTL